MSAKICPQCNTEYPEDQLFCPKDGSTLKGKGGTADLVGSIVQKVYHVKKKLGEGGMGTVYLAEHVKMGRKSALKVMNPGMVHDADAISRFNREAANASKINHPNVAAVYDFGETEDGLIFLAMEFIEGPSLTKVIEDAGSLSPHRAADITRQASEALAVAHDMGIVHRDLKPDNIMLAKGREGADVVKVVDFGIAKAGADEGQKVTKTGMVVGTPEYMSPEQLSGDKLDGRSDTYSLALVTFNMLTGKLPFPAATAQESMIARLMEAPKQLAEMKPDTPWTAEVQAVMDRALAREVADRFQSAADFGRELFKAVQAMPSMDDVTSAHTAVIGRVSGGGAKGAPAKTAVAAKAPTPIPATRVGAATPHAGGAAAPEAAKSKAGLYAGIGAAAVVVVGVGTYLAIKQPDASAPQTLSQPMPEQGSPATLPTSLTAANVDALLDSLDALSDIQGGGTEQSAAVALARLDQLVPSTMTSDQRVHAAWIRAQANAVRGNDGAACKAVMEVEGASKGTKYESRIGTFLKVAAC